MRPLCVFQEGGVSRSKDQIDGTGMSLNNRKGVRVTGKYVPPLDWGSKTGGPCIIHSPPSTPLPPEIPTVISIGPLPHRAPERVDTPRMDELSVPEDWSVETPSKSRVSYGEMGRVPRQTMEELKTILKESPLLSIRGRDEGKPGSPYTYLHGSSRSSGGVSGGGGGGKPDGRQEDGHPSRAFSTFKPNFEVSRKGGPRSGESTSIQQAPNVDSSSSFRSEANTNRQPGVRGHTHTAGGSWAESGASHTGE